MRSIGGIAMVTCNGGCVASISGIDAVLDPIGGLEAMALSIGNYMNGGTARGHTQLDSTWGSEIPLIGDLTLLSLVPQALSVRSPGSFPMGSTPLEGSCEPQGVCGAERMASGEDEPMALASRP